MLTAETIDKWATALETTKFGQFRCSIANEDKTEFCCVGIGAIAMGIDPKDIGASDKELNSIDCAMKLGIDLAIDDSHQFFTMNDKAKLSFKEIAALLRSGEYKTWKLAK